MSAGRPRLLFVSARFPFPVDRGERARTTQLLRALRGGAFAVTLAAPAPPDVRVRHGDDIDACCDRFLSWPAQQGRRRPFGATMPRRRRPGTPNRAVAGVAVAFAARGARVVDAALTEGFDVVVVDGAHADTLVPAMLATPSVLLTHQVEAQTLRHREALAANAVTRRLWRGRHRSMVAFERAALQRYDRVIAVSDRDASIFRRDYGVSRLETLHTGVDLDRFAWSPPGDGRERRVVFAGALDSPASSDAVAWLLDDVWPLVLRRVPDATMRVIGRTAPAALVSRAARRYGRGWAFTGFVDDIRPAVAGAAAFVLPLRLGGGTRVAAFEAMAMGIPVAATSTGVDGLPVRDGDHFLRGDDATSLADALVRLLRDHSLRAQLSASARRHVERHFSHRAVAADFERICLDTMGRGAPPVALAVAADA